MTCTKEEIERKRLAALQKRQNKTLQQSTIKVINSLTAPPRNSIEASEQSNAGPIKNFVMSNKSFRPYDFDESTTKSPPPTKVVTGTVYLISENRFEVNHSEFCAPLIDIFKSIPSKNYDPKSKLWNFSIDDYQELMKKVAQLAPHVVLGPIPPFVLSILQEPTVDPSTIDLTPIEPCLRNKLMPFQEDGVRFGLAKRGRCMIADDMGLGKTFQALAIASYYRHNWPLLIVTTSSMRETWQSKIHELLPSVPMLSIVSLTSSKDAQLVADRQTEVVIVSFKITSMHVDLLMSKKFGVIIVDESHNVKSSKAQCTGALRRLAAGRGGAARLVLLSGTPALSRPAELHAQLQLLQPALLADRLEYGKRYCAGKLTSFGWDMSGQSNLAELQVILQKKFLIRRTKEQVMPELEEKVRETVILDKSLLQFSKQDTEELCELAHNYKSTRARDQHAALLTFFSETARVKMPAVCKYVSQLVAETSEKFLVFAHHRCVVAGVCAALDEAGARYVCIVGSTPAHARAELVDRFQQSESCRAAVLSLTAAGAGLTLTAASLVLFAELHWNPGVLLQAECRAHRAGQRGRVRARYLLAKGTADDHMWPLLRRKLDVLNNVGLSRDTFEDSTVKHQESRNNITQYLSPSVDRSDFIPGTNIRKSALSAGGGGGGGAGGGAGGGGGSDTRVEEFEDVDKSFLEDEEGDELLASLNL